MTDLRKAAEVALEALIGLYETPEFAGTKDISVDRLNRKRSARESIAALRQALAKPEQEPVDVVKVEHARWVELAEMYERGWNAALAKRNPVAWMYVNDDGECEQIEYGEPFDDPSVTPLYTAPPKREWVGLTDEEVKEAYCSVSGTEWAIGGMNDAGFFAELIEAKLKEKNA